MNDKILKGHTCLITGGGRGIGRILALAFGASGASVAVAARTLDQIEETARQINSRGGKARAIPGDITKAEDTKTIVEVTLKEYDKIDVLVNNAGVTEEQARGGPRDLWNLPEEEWSRVLGVNLTGTFLMTKEVLPHMISRREGNVINITSLLGHEVKKGASAPYVVSKSGLEGLTRYLATHLADYSVNANSLYPGMAVRSGFFEEFSDREKEDLGDPQIVVDPALFLASLEPGTLSGYSVNAEKWQHQEGYLEGLR